MFRLLIIPEPGVCVDIRSTILPCRWLVEVGVRRPCGSLSPKIAHVERAACWGLSPYPAVRLAERLFARILDSYDQWDARFDPVHDNGWTHMDLERLAYDALAKGGMTWRRL